MHTTIFVPEKIEKWTRVELSRRKYSRRRVGSYNLASLVATVQYFLWLTVQLTTTIRKFRSSRSARGGRVVLEDSGFSGITALVLTYLWTKCLSTGLIVTDLPPIQRCPQPYAAEICHLYISHLSTLRLVLGISVKLSSSFQQTFDRTIANSIILEDTVVHRYALFLTPHAWHAYH